MRVIYVVPTHVGVNRGRGWCGAWGQSRPHTRGGEPVVRVSSILSKGSSPHTWG